MIATIDTVNVYTPATQLDVAEEIRYAKRLCQEARDSLDKIDDTLANINHVKINTFPADARNNILSGEGYTAPLPYKSGTPIVEIQQSTSSEYVRVYTNGKSERIGKWIMKYSEIQGLTPAEIKNKFALPNLPTHYCVVNVPEATRMYVGIVNMSSVEGTVQFELITRIPENSFGTGILLP